MNGDLAQSVAASTDRTITQSLQVRSSTSTNNEVDFLPCQQLSWYVWDLAQSVAMSDQLFVIILDMNGDLAQSVAMCEQLFGIIVDMNGDLAQSAARWSHNPKVESSILSVPMFLIFEDFWIFF